MTEKRKDIRFQTVAKVRFEMGMEGEALIRDISITGCRVVSSLNVEIKLNNKYTIEITPEKDSKIGGFKLNVESKWIRNNSDSCEIGLAITEFPKGKQFQHYVDYLSWRYAHGNSMTGEFSEDSPDVVT